MIPTRTLGAGSWFCRGFKLENARLPGAMTARAANGGYVVVEYLVRAARANWTSNVMLGRR